MTAELATALVAAQKEMPHVEPDAVNPYFRSRFVSLDHLIAKTRPVLTKHGLAIIQEPTWLDDPTSTTVKLEEDEKPIPGVQSRTATLTPALKTTLLHVSGESLTSTMPLRLTKDDMQGLGAAITYARRYAWAALLGISEQEDDDGNTASQPAAEQNEKATKAQKDHIHRLIDKLEKEGVLGETAIREGMQQAYGTQITTKLTKEQAGDLITRLKAKAGEE